MAEQPSYSPQEIETIARGQRMMILAVACGLALTLLFPLQLLAVPFTWVGVWRMTGGLRLPTVGRVLYMIGVVLPLVPLLVMVALNGRANRAFEAAGVRVGFMGAKMADVAALKARTASSPPTE